jgi:hypothetical protein
MYPRHREGVSNSNFHPGWPDVHQLIASCRASTYRLIRHTLVDADSVKCIDQSLDWYKVVKYNSFPLDFGSDTDVCYERIPNKHAIEKE